jgi:cyclic beta-1,2-glucan synthetase
MALNAAARTNATLFALGAGFVVIGVWASFAAQPWPAVPAAIAGAVGLALWRRAVSDDFGSPLQAAIDAIALAAFTVTRNDSLAFWQLPGSWWDVPRFNPAAEAIAFFVYLGGSGAILLLRRRGPRIVEACGLIAIPFLFNFIKTLAADWHMQEIAALIGVPGSLPFQSQVLVGRFIVMLIFSEAMVLFLSTIGVGRPNLQPRLHLTLLAGALLAAATPLIANVPQDFATSWFVGLVVATVCAALAQAALWAIVYMLTGMTLDLLGGRPPTFAGVFNHFRSGFVKGAIYGALFFAGILLIAAPLREPGFVAFVKAWGLPLAPLAGALAWPLAQTIVGSADGTPPFFGRLAAGYRNARGYARGVVIGLGVGAALVFDLPQGSGGARFVALFVVGALAYAGVDIAFDAARIAMAERRAMQTWRLYALGVLLGGVVAGALGWYFDANQLGVVVAKFWAYADVDYRAAGRQLSDFVIYPIFNKYGSFDLGQIVGGVRLFYSESLSGVINWSIAAPLFSINFVLLAALLELSLRPIRDLFTPAGIEGLVAQAVRVMRWGLWMAPVINSFLRLSPEPSWFNQDGAVRSLVAIGADVGMPTQDFRDFSLTLFLGLLAYDWLRVLIWFDHMGLRVATLVNLSFLGGDRADEGAARFVGHSARTRIIPDGIRRFGTWAPLLIPFYIPRGKDWDWAWNGAAALQPAGSIMPGPVRTLAIAYAVAGAVIALIVIAVVARMRQSAGTIALALTDAPETLARLPRSVTLTNGSVGLELTRDGRGAAFVLGEERAGADIDLTRRPLDPLQKRGPFFYVSEAGETPWSIGFEPSRRAGDYAFDDSGANGVAIRNAVDGIAARIEAGPDPSGAVVTFRITLTETAGRARAARLTSFAEIAAHETGAYANDLDFAGMHVETTFVRALNALLARNRLLYSRRAGKTEMAIFAARAISDNARLVGYEDSRARFLGEGSLGAPEGLGASRPRALDDEGKLWSFDPAASLSFAIALPARGEAVIEFIMARADNEGDAADLVSRRLGLERPDEASLATSIARIRMLEPTPKAAALWPFAFAPDGALRLTHRTPRPWSHVMANERGAGTVVSNDGEVYSFVGNAQQNGLTPYRFDSVAVPQPGQVVYIRDLDSGETDAPGFTPFQREDAEYKVVFQPGVATFSKTRGALAIEYVVFTPPEFPGDMRLLTLSNKGSRTLHIRVAPFFDMALAQSPNDSKNYLTAETVGDVLLFENPRNDFQRGVAFAATSLTDAVTETSRARFFGGVGRDICSPAMVETGAPDLGSADDGRKVAAFVATIAIRPGASFSIAICIGQAERGDKALAAARMASIARVEEQLEKTKLWWARRLGAVRIRTNRPDFDRLVNTWLPYQTMASRLFGRVGPSQRGGAFGFRDQLQDTLPLIFIEPRLTRAQIVLHASQQFLEGDVLKWWHRAPDGKTGLGQRTRASDPQLWLPYVMARYIAQTGDKSVLDDVVPYLEGPAVPEGVDTWLIAPRPSLERGDVYEHCRRAIGYTLDRMGANGLPLLGAGDWNDGIDALGRGGIGTSVWMGFFLFDVLHGFAPLAQARGDATFAARCDAAREALRKALDVAWTGDHYALDFADSGEPLAMPNAMTTGWPAWSGAVDFARGRAAIEGGLKGIERPDRILLTAHPFDEHSRPYPGRITEYPPGVRENGGQYSHGASWIIDGFVRLSEQARAAGDDEAAAHMQARAFEIWEKISPLGKTAPDALARYGLSPNQQPADIYDGFGHGGRGGWSWYTGSAARMLSAAYALVGLRMADGKVSAAPDMFEAKGALQVEAVSAGGRTFARDSEAPEAATSGGALRPENDDAHPFRSVGE